MSSSNTGIGPECRRSNDIKWTEGFLYVVTTHILITTSFQRYAMMQGQRVKSTQANFWRGEEEETHTHWGECAKRGRRISAQSSRVCSFFFYFLKSQQVVWIVFAQPSLSWTLWLQGNRFCGSIEVACVTLEHIMQDFLLRLLSRHPMKLWFTALLEVPTSIFQKKNPLPTHWRLSDINQSVNQSSNQSIFESPEWNASRDFLLWSGT